MTLHILKLAVGVSSADDLVRRQSATASRSKLSTPVCTTRMYPRRTDELLDGGSLYWVIDGMIEVRQPILGFSTVTGADGIARCRIALDRTPVAVRPVRRRPFQGWRYLNAEDAPPDLDHATQLDSQTLHRALSELGLL